MNHIILFLLTLLLLAGCQMETTHQSDNESAPLVDPKYSVSKDRSELDKLRENIPSVQRRENDEKALIAELTAELKYPPEVVREKYANIVRKKRELFNKDMEKQREAFNKAEKKARDESLKSLETERENFLKKKV